MLAMLSPAEVGWDLAAFAQEWLEERFRLTLNLLSQLEENPSPGAVHDVRVACRRLREAIVFFRGVTEVPPLFEVDRAAKRMARAIGPLRETDVARKRLSKLSLGSRHRVAEQAKQALLDELGSVRRSLAKKRKDRIAKRAKKLRTALEGHLPLRTKFRPGDGDASREAQLRAWIEARIAERRAEVERRFDVLLRGRKKIRDDAGVSRLHAVRVAIKHWRYASEIGRAVMPRVLYRPLAAKLRLLQDLGGSSQDAVDLARVVEDALVHRVKPKGVRYVISACRRDRERSALEFYEALKRLLPSVPLEAAG